jgi:hypothetical protein
MYLFQPRCYSCFPRWLRLSNIVALDLKSLIYNGDFADFLQFLNKNIIAFCNKYIVTGLHLKKWHGINP